MAIDRPMVDLVLSDLANPHIIFVLENLEDIHSCVGFASERENCSKSTVSDIDCPVCCWLVVF